MHKMLHNDSNESFLENNNPSSIGQVIMKHYATIVTK